MPSRPPLPEPGLQNAAQGLRNARLFVSGTADSAMPQLPRWRLALSGIPDLINAAIFWQCWQQPQSLPQGTLKALTITMVMQFFVVHSGGFMAMAAFLPATRAGRVRYTLGLSAFYMLIVWMFAHLLDATWLYWVFGWMFLSKAFVSWSLSRSAEEARQEQMIDWPFAVAAYLCTLILGFTLFGEVRGGITPEVFAASGLADAGLFEDRPWAALGAGVLYFGAMGLWRLRLWRWFRRRAA